MSGTAPMAKPGANDNRLELLLFNLAGPQRFGINVLKVKEIIPCPHLTHLPDSRPAVRGIAHLRGTPLSVIDLATAIGRGQIAAAGEPPPLIITEFSRRMQGFLVRRVDRIVIKDWRDVLPPPRGVQSSYVTGVTKVADELVQILDVERVLGEILPEITDCMTAHGADEVSELLQGRKILVVDDSMVARTQTARTLSQIGADCMMVRDGREALEALENIAREDGDVYQRIAMVISDIEMPEMDGYTLVHALRADPRMRDLYVLLHTSLDAAMNMDKAVSAGADTALTKFVPDELAACVVKGLREGRVDRKRGR